MIRIKMNYNKRKKILFRITKMNKKLMIKNKKKENLQDLKRYYLIKAIIINKLIGEEK